MIAALLPYADKSAVRDLLANMGYDTRGKDITAGLCMQAFKEYGPEFGKPFASILRKGVESPRFEAEKQLFLKSKLNKTNSTTNKSTLGSSMTTDQKVGLIEKGIDSAMSILLGGLDYGKAVNGNKAAQDETEQLNAAQRYLQQMQQTQTTDNSNTLKWFAIGGGAFLFVVLLIVIIVVIGKK